MSTTVYEKFFNQADKDCIVRMVVVTASANVSTVGKGMPNGRNLFHWRFYLKLEPGQTRNMSVVIDMQPVNPPFGCMIISSKLESGSTAACKIELPILTRSNPTVGQMINVFLGHKMHCYKFDDSGAGCLYWTLTGLNLLEKYGLVEHGAVEKLDRFHKEQAEMHPEMHLRPVRKGVFY